MPDSVVDRTGSDLPDPSPAPTDSTPSSNGESSRRNVGAERRIAELVKEKHEINRAWQGKYDALMERIDALEARSNPVGPVGDKRPTASKAIFTSYGELEDGDLDELIAKGPGENPGVFAAALKETTQRALARQKAELLQATQAQQKAEQSQQKVWNDIVKRFGPEVDQDSPLRQRADQYMAEMKRQYGQDIVRNMEAQRQCFALAHHDLHAQDKDELAAARREVERAKQSQALESGARGAAKLTNDVEASLKKRDIKGAVSSLSREMLRD